MKTFPHWRAVGAAMRWARQQQGVIQGPATFDQPYGRECVWGWYADGQTVRVNITWGIGFTVVLRGPRMVRIEQGVEPAEVLRVLAALDLIPAHLAYGSDERFARCLRCDRTAQWVPAEGDLEARWCHLDPTPPYHRPEVVA